MSVDKAVDIRVDSLSTRARILAALGIGLTAGAVALWLITRSGPEVLAMDFSYSYLAAEGMVRRIDPYDYVFHSAAPWGPYNPYPATAGVVSIPFLAFAPREAAVVFVAVSCGLLAFGLTRNGFWRLALFLSAPAYQSIHVVQWTPFLVAVSLVTPLIGCLCLKPQIAVSLIVGQSNWRFLAPLILGSVLIGLVSLVLVPGWPLHWVHLLRTWPHTNQYKIPILSIWGMPLVLAAFKWRRPEARLLFVMACTPQTIYFYDQLVLFLVPQSRPQMIALGVVSWLAFLAPTLLHWTGTIDTTGRGAPNLMLAIYLATLVMVLRAPNVVPHASAVRHHEA
jgi:hypothetical protein